MKEIPRIIHQIWSGVDEPLPDLFKVLGETWKECNPTWQYELWDNDRMNNFVLEYYPQYWDIYSNFTYNVQRWDSIRYLILDKIGGMYVDFDSECFKSFNPLLLNKSCCFSMEPQEHALLYNKDVFFNNALMASIPGHPFMKAIIQHVFTDYKKTSFTTSKQKGVEVQETTGPLALVKFYEEYADKSDIYLIPAEYVSPFTQNEVVSVRKGIESEELERKLNKAYSVHYFFNTWLYGINVTS